MYKYLFWDVDGTILDFEAAEEAAMKKLFLEFGFGVLSDERLARYSAINKKYWEALERNEMTKPQILVERFKEFFENEGLDKNRAREFNDAFQNSLGETIVFHDNAYEILKEEKKNHVLVAITNGTLIAQKMKLSKSGLDMLFDYIFISELIGVEKPNKGFFEKALKDTGIDDLSQILIIGDSLTSDIKGGINMGIDTCWYNPNGVSNSSDNTPKYVISNLSQLEAII